MSGEQYHKDGDCDPTSCRECEWAAANEREDHERKVCDLYPECRFCFDQHDCDKTYELKCPSCNPMRTVYA